MTTTRRNPFVCQVDSVRLLRRWAGEIRGCQGRNPFVCQVDSVIIAFVDINFFYVGRNPFVCQVDSVQTTAAKIGKLGIGVAIPSYVRSIQSQTLDEWIDRRKRVVSQSLRMSGRFSPKMMGY